MKKQNVRIAKQLVKLAKSLMADSYLLGQEDKFLYVVLTENDRKNISEQIQNYYDQIDNPNKRLNIQIAKILNSYLRVHNQCVKKSGVAFNNLKLMKKVQSDDTDFSCACKFCKHYNAQEQSCDLHGNPGYMTDEGLCNDFEWK